jgi:hypothetical protein
VEELQKQLLTVQTSSGNIYTKLEHDKRANTVLERGILVQPRNLILAINKETQQLEYGITHK